VIAYTIFETPIGRCAVAWSGAAIVGAALPEADDAGTIRNATRLCPDAAEAAPPAWVRDVVERVQRLLAGEAAEFSDVPLALDRANAFERQVYRALLSVPHGETRTYGALAAAIGQPGAGRAVGRALGRNPIPIIIPCHRVVAADGRTGGFSAPGGVTTKMKLLEIERARSGPQASLFDLPWAAAPARA
jgi:methylated-DNA-[protein]-cysteine S-methyltransferase